MGLVDSALTVWGQFGLGRVKFVLEGIKMEKIKTVHLPLPLPTTPNATTDQGLTDNTTRYN